MTSREDVHRLVDAVPEARLPVVEQVLRASISRSEPALPRQFASSGALSAEYDMAERCEEILREDPGAAR